MRTGLSKILITGGAGFIGSAFVRLMAKKGYKIIIVDKLTYAGDLARLREVEGKYKFYKADITNQRQIESIFKREKPETMVHFAAETHVDRSIQDAEPFIETNIKGTQILLDAARTYKIKKIIHISSDEVYGEIKKGVFFEDSPLKPNSPYAVSKTAADLLIKAYIRTYDFPAIIVRPCNNYGPWQYPEKLIPLSILKIIRKEKIPVYALGENVREWLYVQDCAQGIFEILKKGKCGETYNLGSGQEKNNLAVVRLILKIFNVSESLIQFVKDRPGHDIRYSLNSGKIINEIGWRPKVKFELGIKFTINWCLKHKDWLLSKWEHIAPLYK
jgi:dTDP-glucose 4,6-dehydratase